MTGNPSLAVIIVNFNGGARFLDLLDALAAQSLDHDTLIVDNASHDGSARMAHSRYPAHTYLPLRYNTGFAHAVNVAVRRAHSDIIVLLNPDTVPQPDFLAEIIRPFAGRPRLGAVAGTLVFESDPGIIASAGIQIQRNGLAIDRLIGKPVGATASTDIFGASGGAAAYRRSAFLAAGGFPDVFFMYQEDVDLAFRLQLRGWDAVWQPTALATHAYSSSAGEGSPFKAKLIARNRIWTLARCLPRTLWTRNLMNIVGYDASALAYGLIADRASAWGRAEALARLPPRFCERRAIDPDGGDIQRIEAWLEPSISLVELRRLRRLTATLASGG